MSGKQWNGWCAAALLVVLGAASVRAQDRTVARWYGEGVHAFYDGDNASAERWLRKVVERTPDDPRPYYFLGLALLGQQQDEAGREAIAQGAAIEATRAAMAFDMSKALLRVQGRGRLLIEQAREKARRDRAAAAAARARVRYEQRKAAEQLTLYPPQLIPGADKVSVSLPANADNSNDPFLSGKLFAKGKPAANQPTTPKVARPTTPASSTPVTTQPAATAKKKSPPAKTADPFGSGDPFGGGAPASKKAPAKKTPPAKNEDPFADPFK